MQFARPELTKDALIDRGCIELKDFVKQYPYGSCFCAVREFQVCSIESGTPIKMVGYWQFENGNGANVHLNGDQLVYPTSNQPEPSIYAVYGLDKQRHDEILRSLM